MPRNTIPINSLPFTSPPSVFRMTTECGSVFLARSLSGSRARRKEAGRCLGVRLTPRAKSWEEHHVSDRVPSGQDHGQTVYP
jgi:hypothetical protein